MSGNVGTNGGKSGFTVFLLITLALALGAGLTFYLKSGPAGTGQTATEATPTENGSGTAATAGQQAAVPDHDTAAQNGAVQVQGSVAVIATDDPSYLSCIERPLAQSETRDQRTAFCNDQLQAQQGGTQAPSGQQ